MRGSSGVADYSGRDLALIIPTKDRPQKMENLLASLAKQTIVVGRVIIVDGGSGIDDLVRTYSAQLPIDYVPCHPPGQIRQRNLAIAQLDSRTRLACFLDDDLVLDPRALESAIVYWNTLGADTAGVSLNIVNNPPFKHSFLASLVGMSAPRMGRILRSGYNVPISPTPANIQVDWLCGGATVWRQDIVATHHHSEIKAKWAICEDIIFSYPLSRTFKLYVCADARVLHEHVFDHNKKVDHRFYGRAATLWRLHFVSSNPELSKLLCGYMLSAQIAIRLAQSAVRRDRTLLDYALGQIDGLRIGFGRVLAGRSLVPILNELT
jgi:glycosyltransferase involved in cell wall biosynthesis